MASWGAPEITQLRRLEGGAGASGGRWLRGAGGRGSDTQGEQEQQDAHQGSSPLLINAVKENVGTSNRVVPARSDAGPIQ